MSAICSSQVESLEEWAREQLSQSPDLIERDVLIALCSAWREHRAQIEQLTAERDTAVERERLQRECVVCHADLEPDRVLVPHCNDCVVTDEHEWEWHDRLTQLNALGAETPQSRADGPREPSTTPSSIEGPAGPRPLSFSTAEHVDAHVRALLVEQLGVDEDEVTDEAKFWDDLGADSLDLIELVMACEDDFEIEIPDEVAEGFVTVGPAIAWITRRVLEKAGPK